MRIGTNDEHLELEERERLLEAPGSGDVKLNVGLRLQSFRGTYDRVWIAESDRHRFLDQLRVLEAARVGSAKLLSMSRDEFTLDVRSTDALGHMEVEAQLHRYQYSGRKSYPVHLSGGFEVDPGVIMQLINFFT